MSTVNLHRYLLGWTGVFVAFGVTFPIAMTRVSQSEKFAAQPFHSLSCEGHEPADRSTVTFQSCAQMKVQPIANTSSSQVAQTLQPIALSGAPFRSTAAAPDPFREAFQIAEQAVVKGRIANTSADWRKIALQWGQAADLMAQVTPADPRYSIAQNRILLYWQNHQAVLQRANRPSP